MFEPNLNVLPAAQKVVWPDLKNIPSGFVLYGGTALVLRLGHRESIDFDFFSQQSFARGAMLPLLQWANPVLRRDSDNTIEILLPTPHGPVKISFFGSLNQNRINEPDQCSNGVFIASLLDIAGSKMLTIQQRAVAKDYQDVWACIRTGLSLEEMLSAAMGIFGPRFQPMISLKALSSFGDGDLGSLDPGIKSGLVHAVENLHWGAMSPLPALAGGLVP